MILYISKFFPSLEFACLKQPSYIQGFKTTGTWFFKNTIKMVVVGSKLNEEYIYFLIIVKCVEAS